MFFFLFSLLTEWRRWWHTMALIHIHTHIYKELHISQEWFSFPNFSLCSFTMPLSSVLMLTSSLSPPFSNFSFLASLSFVHTYSYTFLYHRNRSFISSTFFICLKVLRWTSFPVIVFSIRFADCFFFLFFSSLYFYFKTRCIVAYFCFTLVMFLVVHWYETHGDGNGDSGRKRKWNNGFRIGTQNKDQTTTLLQQQ